MVREVSSLLFFMACSFAFTLTTAINDARDDDLESEEEFEDPAEAGIQFASSVSFYIFLIDIYIAE